MHELRDVPQDTITSISYNGDLLSSSWDGSLSLHCVATLGVKKRVRGRDPVLRTVFGTRILAGDTSGNVRVYDRSLSGIASIRTEVGGIQLLHEHRNRVVAGGWNRKISFVSEEGGTDTLDTENKVCCSDLYGDTLVVGQQEYVVAYDLRTNSSFCRRKFSMPVRCVVLADGGFFAGTTGGRIYYEDFNDEAKSYVFNAHCSVSENTKTFYPVNALRMDGNLYSGGSDGRVLRWRLLSGTCKEVMRSAVGISELCAFDGRLAVGISYTYDRGESRARSRIVVVDQ